MQVSKPLGPYSDVLLLLRAMLAMDGTVVVSSCPFTGSLAATSGDGLVAQEVSEFEVYLHQVTGYVSYDNCGCFRDKKGRGAGPGISGRQA